jgi:polar amino acid transport system substrate-binding protein
MGDLLRLLREARARFLSQTTASLKVLVATLLACGIASASAQQPGIKVATRIVPPFVEQQGDRLTGFSIDLWRSLAAEMGMKSTYLVKPTVSDLLHSVAVGEADVGIAAISITSERDKKFDFSQPMFDAGLQIMTTDAANRGSAFSRIEAEFLASGILRWLTYIFVFGMIPAHIVWLFERRHHEGLIRHRSYFPGIFEAYWWSLACLATQAEEMPKSVLGRVVAILWMFTAVIFVAYFTAQVTANMTVQQLSGVIKGPEDLQGKRVATTKGSTSAEYLHQHGADVIEFAEIGQAYTALEDGGADAVVFDSPVLLYYASHDGKGRVHLVGDVFRKESYGIAFRPGSALRKPVETALLALKEDGTYQQIYDKWFGE